MKGYPPEKYAVLRRVNDGALVPDHELSKFRTLIEAKNRMHTYRKQRPNAYNEYYITDGEHVWR